MFLGRMVCTAVIKHSVKCLWECAWKPKLKKCQAVIFSSFTAASDQWIKDLLDTNAWRIVGWFGFQLRLRDLCTGALTSRQALDCFYRYAYDQQTWKKNGTHKKFVNEKRTKKKQKKQQPYCFTSIFEIQSLSYLTVWYLSKRYNFYSFPPRGS